MKKRHSKNRHFSKGINSFKIRQRLTNRMQYNSKSVRSANLHLAEKSFRWSLIGTVIQLADFFIDKGPKVVKWLFYLLGMG